MFRTILCPFDFSDFSRQALRYAALLARRSRGRLIVLYAEDPLLVNAAANANFDAKELLANCREDLGRVVRRTIARYGISDSQLTLKVVVGRPHAEIRATAKALGCDLIVMGTQGISGVGKLMFGSTTQRVLRQAEIPVLAIPPEKRVTLTPSSSWPAPWVLAPVDLGPKDAQDALTAALVADGFGARLLLLHVVEPGDGAAWERMDLNRLDLSRRLKARAEARLDALRLRTEAAAPTAWKVAFGHPARAIALAAADKHIGLVIMTRRRGLGLFGPRQGAISYEVLCGARTPVLALPADSKWIRRAVSPRSKQPAA